MNTSFSTALSALNAMSTAIDATSNNLANLNTTGYKASTVSFKDLVAESLGGATGQTEIGFGVGTPITTRSFTQGAVQPTGAPLDCAIQGDGFLILKTPKGLTEYTRDGSLRTDNDGNLVTSTGEFVQGWSGTNGSVNTSGALGNITLPVGNLKPPVATTKMSLDLNLNSAATAGPPPSTFSTSMEVYDSLGASHSVNVTFTKDTGANAWKYAVTAPDGTVAVTPATGTLQFDGTGVLTAPAATDPAPVIAITGLTNGASDLSITWSLFNGTAPRLTQFAQPSAVAANSQDGSASSQLTHVSIGDGGSIVAQYSNGQQSIVGQLALASIRNPESMKSVGNNNFELDGLSPAPAVGLPSTGQRGALLSGALESSTVDIAKEFTNLIVLQRGYQANSKVITTVDDMSQTTINIKRD